MDQATDLMGASAPSTEKIPQAREHDAAPRLTRIETTKAKRSIRLDGSIVGWCRKGGMKAGELCVTDR